MRNLTEEEIRKAGEIFSKRMQKDPREIRIAVGLTMTNVISKGCPWATVPASNVEFMNALDDINKSQHVNAYKIGGSQKGKGKEDMYLMLVSQKLVVDIVNKEAGAMIYDQKDFIHAIKKRDSALAELKEFLEKGKVGTIGIFNTNEGHNIIADGVNYPAFAVTLIDLLSYGAVYGYSLMVKGHKISMKTAASKIEGLYENLQVAPNGHALMISITR